MLYRLNTWWIGLIGVLAVVVEAEPEAKHLGMDLNISAQQQQFSDTHAELYGLSITPYYVLGDWDVSVTLPYNSYQGNYFSNGVRPFITDVCSRLLSLSNLQQQILVRRGRITQQQLDNCEAALASNEAQDVSTEGMGDISLGLHWLKQANPISPWFFSFGLNYSLDNGDYDQALGTGSQDTLLSSGVSYMGAYILLGARAGYTFVNATDAIEPVQDYANAGFVMEYQFTDSIAGGCDYNFEQAYAEGLDDVQMLTAYVNYRFAGHWQLHGFYSGYIADDEYPDSEVGISLKVSF